MDKWANRLSELRKRKKTSQTSVSIAINISQSRLSKLEKGGIIPSDLLLLFADYYDVSTDYILKRSDDKICISNGKLSIDEQEILSFYRQLTPHDRKLFNGIVLVFKDTHDGK